MKTNRITIGVLLAFLMTAQAGAARAQSAELPPRAIEVSGQGEAKAAPDLATLNLAIETHGVTAAQCAKDNAALAQKVVAALKAKLGDRAKITTGGYSLSPEYDQHPNPPRPTIVGYRAENSVSLETAALDQLGSVIDAAIAAGANRVNSLDFSLRNDGAARAEAIAKASKDAEQQAHALAASLGVKLKRVYRASTITEARPRSVTARMGMMAHAPTPVEPGQLTIPATVTLTYEIE